VCQGSSDLRQLKQACNHATHSVQNQQSWQPRDDRKSETHAVWGNVILLRSWANLCGRAPPAS
jgi:hypothetical protein